MGNGSKAPTIELPQGGGALKSIGEKFAPDLFTGTGNYSVPIELPSGRNGFQPQLRLVYSTGSGNSPFGLGWSLSIPGVTRKTAKMVPLYDDDKDIFVLSGYEDLVPVANETKSTRYRPRTEASFARIVHQRDNLTDRDYWEIRSRDGTVSLYGTLRPANASADWLDPAVIADPAKPHRRYAWKLTETRDPFGNRMQFIYRRDAVRMDGPHRWDQIYLAEIRYVDYGNAAAPAFLVHIKFRYEFRPDPFSDYRPGFEIRTVQRCTGIEVWTDAATPTRARTYHLMYLDQVGLSRDQLPENGVSLLAQILVEGHDDQQRRSQTLPPLQLRYGAFEPKDRRFEPIVGPELPPASLGSPHYGLVDLFGNGLPDVVEMNGQVRYWRNLGGRRFDRPQFMRRAPAGLALADPGVQLMDADGDGRADLVVTQPELSGYYPLTFQGGWDRRSFRQWAMAPSFNLEDPEVKLVDLDGDGVTDALRSGTSFECYFNHAHRGWHDTRRVARRRLEDFPNVSFSDPRVKWADITGDGLTDIALVHDGRVDYWPSLGRGDFAPRITMRNSPRFPYGYDPRRILVGDVDGDGAADLVYVDHRKVLLWINHSGNSWSDPIEILGTPSVTDMDSVRLADLLGTGVPGVFWSRDAAPILRERMFFLDFTEGHKPYLLERIDNGIGAITNIAHAPSTQFYLEDLGTPLEWRTPLPFPIHIVARVESIDQISGGKVTTEYSYHHGYWDGAEREFRGFGRVDQRDTEVFEDYHASGLDTEGRSFKSVELRYFSPPTELRTWFQVGPLGEEVGEWEELDCSDEFWGGDLRAFDRLGDVRTSLRALVKRAQRDALRALRGRILHTETYTHDGSARADRPYTVTEQVHGVRAEVLPSVDGANPGVFFPYQVVERTTQWERGDDPMTHLAFTDNYDVYGQPRLQVSIAIPRGRNYRARPDPSAEPFLVTHVVTGYAQRDDADHYIIDRVAHRTNYEVLDDGRSSISDPQPSALELWERITAKQPVRQQIIGQTLNYYDGNDFDGLSLGQVGGQGALKRIEQLVLTEDLLRDAYRSGPSVSTPPEEPRYLDHSGEVTWTDEYPLEFRTRISQFAQPPPRGTAVLGGYIFHAGDTIRQRGLFAANAQRAHDSRGLVRAERDALGNETRIEYTDGYELLPTKIIDPAQLETTASYDYRTLQPNRVTDPNDNETEYRYTPLGLLESIGVLGKPGQNEGDTTDRPSTRFEYGFEAFSNLGQPIYTHTTRRTHHANETDVPVRGRDDAIENREYSDGFGRLLQTRMLGEDSLFGSAEFANDVLPRDQSSNSTAVRRLRVPGAPPNVVVSGWQTYDNKGRVVEKHEPFFSTGWDYAAPTGSQFGYKATLYYDSRGRIIRTSNPDGSEQLTVFGIAHDITDPVDFVPSPWESYAYDANDNANRTLSADPHAEHYGHHWNTPTSTVIDAQGRVIEQVERNGPNPGSDWYKIRQDYDIRGNLIKVWDQVGRLAFQHVYDLSNRQLRTEQLDAGIRRTVFDAAGDIIEQRDRKGCLILHARDRLRRATHVWARDSSGERVTVREREIYGDSSESGVATAAAKLKNLLGKPNRWYDEAGLLRFEVYDFKGNVVEKVRQVISDDAIRSAFGEAAANDWQVTAYRADWQPASGSDLNTLAMNLLDATAYHTSKSYDALNRVNWVDYPANANGLRKRLKPAYNRAGALECVFFDGKKFVECIAYNAKGQRTLIAYGDRDLNQPGPRVMTRYAYDPKTFRLLRIRTEKFNSPTETTFAPAGGTLQDLSYDYDLAGNLLSLHDRTPGSGISGQPDSLDRLFVYDALYRLLSGTGRECDKPPPNPWDLAPRCYDITRTRGYRQDYGYDSAGNLMRLEHHLTGGTGDSVPTRYYDLVPGTNQLAAMEIGSTRHQYQYDASGNITRENTERYLEWDYNDRLRVFRIQASAAEPSQYVHYLYDAAGQRVKKLVRKQGGRVEVTVYIDGAYEYHRVANGAGTNEYEMFHVLDGETRIALIRVGHDPEDTTPPVKFHIGDHIGSSVLVLDQSGTWINREEYTPYGETSFGSFARKRFRFNGRERDEESGFIYHGQRLFAPWLARWTSADPLGSVDGLNLYQPMQGNPLRYKDPTGGETVEPEVDLVLDVFIPDLIQTPEGFEGAEAPAFSRRQVEAYLPYEVLTAAEIKGIRAYAETLEAGSKEQREVYARLQYKVRYLTQRDNESRTKFPGDPTRAGINNMCNLTSLAMALGTLGIDHPGSYKGEPYNQFEDYLEAVRGDWALGKRTERKTLVGLAELFGVSDVQVGSLKHFDKKTDWRQLDDYLERGYGIAMSISGHIVRLVDVTDKGLVVDDPYGDLTLRRGPGWKHTKNAPNSYDTKGSHDVLNWSRVLKHQFKWFMAIKP